MKRFIKCGIVLCLLCGLLTTTAMAGNSSFSRYNFGNTGRTWLPTSSYNTKATTRANWFIQVNYLSFGGGNTSGTLGIAHAPTLSNPLVPMAYTHWALSSDSYAKYYAWLPDCGAANLTYQLGVRLDDLIYPISAATTTGYWNSN